MEALRNPRQQLPSELNLMNPIYASFRATLCLRSVKFRCFCTSAPNLTSTEEPTRRRKSVLRENGRVRAKVSDAHHQLKENWLDSLTYPFPAETTDVRPSNAAGSKCVLGIDPDVSGALALLRTDDSGCSVQVFDSPQLKVLVGRRIRRRLDAKSIVQLLQSFDAPIGSTAFVEQSLPYPQDGKQGWWSGGFGYGLWIGVLVASGFSVIPVPSLLWKNEFKLSGNGSSKDDSRVLASTLFPSMSSLLKRKKDHGRAEALLIAAYGKGLKVSSDSSGISEELAPQKLKEC